MFTSHAEDAVRRGTEMNLTALAMDYTGFMVAWENEQWNATELPAVGVGSPVEISRELLQKYRTEVAV